MKLLLTYKLANDLERLTDFAQNIGTEHELTFVVFDCRLEKTEFSLPGGKIIPLEFEESLQIPQKVLELATQTNSQFFISIEESVEFTLPRSLDLLFDEDIINDPNISSVYSDFEVSYEGLRVPHFHTSLPSKLSAFPLLAVKTEFAQRIPNWNIQTLAQVSVVKHVPQILALIHT